MGILAWIVFGFVIGLIARALVPGRQSMGLVTTTLLGIAGSLVGGLVASAITGSHADSYQSAGFIGSIIGAIALLLIAGVATGRRTRTV